MQRVITEHAPSFHKLGFTERPRLEVRPGPGVDPADVYGPAVIVERKLDVSTAAIAQVRRYHDVAADRDPRRGWRGHRMAGRSVSAQAI